MNRKQRRKQIEAEVKIGRSSEQIFTPKDVQGIREATQKY
ncbi:6194_t:CDS:2 [Funneliformis mosseae]|uniref:6194_t:CDS:1 n=1 Tax=Funneliformis mosseae TaxID=27381 RepID=A0A9N9CEH4_FUNMO|nr:6194_t:CDS:2 [Funneliformis mosseae]